MKRFSLTAAVVTSLSLPAFAQAPAPAPAPAKAAPAPAKAAPAPAPAAAAPAPAVAAPAPAPAGGPDMSKLGPASRKPTNEAKTKKEITDFINAETALLNAKNYDALADRVDYPVFMMTDDAAGVPSGMATPREQYVGDMKPFWENTPAGTKVTHKLAISVLSDSLANVTDDYVMTMGKTTSKGRNASIVVKVGGVWKIKAMTEAGWGDMPTGGSAAAPAPAPAKAAPSASPIVAPSPAPAKAPAPAPAPAKK